MQISNTYHPTNVQDRLENQPSVRLEAGQKLPLKVQLSGEVFKDLEISHTIEVAKSFFMTLDPEEGPYFKSLEQAPWQSFEDYFTGRIDAGISIESDSPDIEASVGLNLNVRA